MGMFIKALAWIYQLFFGGTVLGKIAMWGTIGVAGLIGLKVVDWSNDRAAIRNHEEKKIEHVRKKVKNARRAARGVRTNSDVRRVLEKAARGN